MRHVLFPQPYRKVLDAIADELEQIRRTKGERAALEAATAALKVVREAKDG